MAYQGLVGIRMYSQLQGSKKVQVHCCLLTTLQIQIKLKIAMQNKILSSRSRASSDS